MWIDCKKLNVWVEGLVIVNWRLSRVMFFTRFTLVLLFLNSWDEFDDTFGDATSTGKLTGLELAIVTEDSLEMVKVNSCSNFLQELTKQIIQIIRKQNTKSL